MMKRILRLLFVLVFAVMLSSCSSSSDGVYPTDDYYDSGENGEQETPDYDPGDKDLSNGGEILQAETPTLPERKIIYEAEISLLSEDIEASYTEVTNTLDSYTAYVEAENITNKQIDVVIRVLSSEFDDLVNDLKSSGELLNYTKTSEDITNAYSTYEARLEALETQHDRLVVLMDQATDLDDILTLEEQLIEIEAELNTLGQKLATYDSLVDYSTITLSIDYIYNLQSLLPETDRPNVTIVDQTTDTVVLDVYNKSERDVTLYVNVLDNGEVIQQYERQALGESTERFNIGDLDSGTRYHFVVSALQSESLRSDEHVVSTETLPTFGSRVSNTFDASLASMIMLGKGLVLVATALVPYLVVGAVIFVPLYIFVIKPRRIKTQAMRKEIRERVRQQRNNKKHDE